MDNKKISDVNDHRVALFGQLVSALSVDVEQSKKQYRAKNDSRPASVSVLNDGNTVNRVP